MTIMLTTKMQCLTCGKQIAASLFNEPHRRPAQLREQYLALQRIADAHACGQTQTADWVLGGGGPGT